MGFTFTGAGFDARVSRLRRSRLSFSELCAVDTSHIRGALSYAIKEDYGVPMASRIENACAQAPRENDKVDTGLLELGAVSKETKGSITGRWNEDSIWPFRLPLL